MFLYSLDSTTILCHFHINEKTPWEYNIFCVSQTCHTKEGEKYSSTTLPINIWAIDHVKTLVRNYVWRRLIENSKLKLDN